MTDPAAPQAEAPKGSPPDDQAGPTPSASTSRAPTQSAGESNPHKKMRNRVRRTCTQCRESHRSCDRGLPACAQCIKSGKASVCYYTVEPDGLGGRERHDFERVAQAIASTEDRHRAAMYTNLLSPDSSVTPGQRRPVEDLAGELARLSVAPIHTVDAPPTSSTAPLVQEASPFCSVADLTLTPRRLQIIESLRASTSQSQAEQEKAQALSWSFGDALTSGETSLSGIISLLPSPAQLLTLSTIYFRTTHMMDLYIDKAAVNYVVHLICAGRAGEVHPHSLAMILAMCGQMTTEVVGPGTVSCMPADPITFYDLACSWVRLSIRCLVVSDAFDRPTLDAVRALALVGTFAFAEGARNNPLLLEKAMSTAQRLGIHNEAYAKGKSAGQAEFGRRTWWKICCVVRVGDEFTQKLPKLTSRTVRMPTPGILTEDDDADLLPKERLLRARCECLRLEHDLAVTLEAGCELELIDELEIRLQDIVSGLAAHDLQPVDHPSEFYKTNDHLGGALIPHACCAAAIFYAGIRLHRPFVLWNSDPEGAKRHREALLDYSTRLIDLFIHFPIDLARSSILGWVAASASIALMFLYLQASDFDEQFRENLFERANEIYRPLLRTISASTVMRTTMIVVEQLMRRVNEVRFATARRGKRVKLEEGPGTERAPELLDEGPSLKRAQSRSTTGPHSEAMALNGHHSKPSPPPGRQPFALHFAPNTHSPSPATAILPPDMPANMPANPWMPGWPEPAEFPQYRRPSPASRSTTSRPESETFRSDMSQMPRQTVPPPARFTVASGSPLAHSSNGARPAEWPGPVDWQAATTHANFDPQFHGLWPTSFNSAPALYVADGAQLFYPHPTLDTSDVAGGAVLPPR